MEINRLIVKYLAGCLTKDEEQILEEWLKDESNQHFFEEICSEKDFLVHYRQYRRFSEKSDEAFRKVWTSLRSDSIENRQKKRRYNISYNWLKIACSLLILLLLSGGMFFIYSSSEKITPGESKALLTLQDGSAKELKASQHEHWIYLGNIPVAREYNGMITYQIPETLKKRSKHMNTLSVPRGGEFYLTLSDGTKIHLNSMSELRFPVSFNGQEERIVELKGEGFFEVAKDTLHPFKVLTQGVEIQQIGTKFNVKSRTIGQVEVALVEGSIGISTEFQKMYVMSPGQLATLNTSSKTMVVESKKLLSHIAWHSNRFVFYDESLGNLLEDIALWYNVDVEYLDESLKELHFTGSLYRYDDINVILNAIGETVDVDFKISGLCIKVDRKNK